MILYSTYSVVLSLDDFITFCGFGCHFQPTRRSCLQLCYLTQKDTANQRDRKKEVHLKCRADR